MPSISRKNIILTANSASETLAQKVAAELSIPFTRMEKQQFADGEIHHKFPAKIPGKDVIIIGSTPDDSSLQELIDLIDGSRYWSADSVNVVIPFLGYSTMERAKPASGEIPKGITRTRQIFRARPDFVFFIDLHSEAVLHAHDGNISTFHIQTDDFFVELIRKMHLDNFALVSPDYGRSKWVAGLASKLGCPHTAADKDRFAMDKTMVSQVSGVVEGKTVIILDDMIRTGGSIIQTAERCRQVGAQKILVMTTHLVLCGKAMELFRQSPVRKIIGTDTYPGVKGDDLREVVSVAPLIAASLQNRLKIF